MNEAIPEIHLNPIGVVKNEAKTLEDRVWEELVSDLVIREEFTSGLEGIDSFSHLVLLYWTPVTAPL